MASCNARPFPLVSAPRPPPHPRLVRRWRRLHPPGHDCVGTNPIGPGPAGLTWVDENQPVGGLTREKRTEGANHSQTRDDYDLTNSDWRVKVTVHSHPDHAGKGRSLQLKPLG